MGPNESQLPYVVLAVYLPNGSVFISDLFDHFFQFLGKLLALGWSKVA